MAIALLFWLSAFQSGLLPSGQAVNRSLDPAERHTYTIAIPEAGRYLVQVDQDGVDLRLTLQWGSHQEEIDSPLDEYGRETLILNADSAGEVTLEVSANRSNAPSGRYTLTWKACSTETDCELEAIESKARSLYAEGGNNRFEEAADIFLSTADAWRLKNDTRREAYATYQAAVILRLLRRNEQATKQAKRALSLLQSIQHDIRIGFTLNELGLLALRAQDLDQATHFFENAYAVRQRAGHLAGMAASRSNLCVIMMNRDQRLSGRDCFLEALEHFDQAGDVFRKVSVHTSLGRVFDLLADPEEALSHYQAGLAILQQSSDRNASARLHNNMGTLLKRLGRFESAVNSFQMALTQFEAVENTRWQARVLNNWGNLYMVMDDHRAALTLLKKALTLRRQVGDVRGEIATLLNLGRSGSALGDFVPAKDDLRLAETLAAENNRRSDSARAQARLAEIAVASGDLNEAKIWLEKALRFFDRESYPGERAFALHLRGLLRARQGFSADAAKDLDTSLALYQATGNRFGKAQVLHELSQLALANGRFDKAVQQNLSSLDLAETIIEETGLPEMQSILYAPLANIYDLRVRLLMTGNHDMDTHLANRLGIEAALRGRAIQLRRALSERGKLLNGQDRPVLRALEEAYGMLRLKADALQKTKRDAEHREASEAAYTLTRERVRSLTRQFRQESPALARLSNLTAPNMEALFEDHAQTTAIYHVGEETSFAWLIAQGTIQSIRLPGRKALETLVRQSFIELSTQKTQRGSRNRSVHTLSSLLIPAEWSEKIRDRLVVSLDGPLHYLPFGALTHPATGQPLVASTTAIHSHLPDHPSPKRNPTQHEIAIFADPVFSANDSRIVNQSAGQKRSGESILDQELARLPYSGLEAESIARLAQAPAKLYVGFEATRNNLFRQKNLAFLHIATHGIYDTDNPDLSGMMLTRMASNGNSHEGFVRALDLFAMDLSGTTVVLSGCQTALGRHLRGEGPLGLARGFLHAGAGNVVASLWSVPDRTTAEFMRIFYQAMLQGKQQPEDALRAAQNELRSNSRTRQSYFWAGFTIQGYSRND